MNWMQWLLSFIGVLGLIFVLFYALRRLNKRVSVSSGRLKVLDRISIGRDGMLLVVSVCGSVMLVGVTSQRIEKLCDLDVTEEEYSANRENTDFMSVFSAVMGKKVQQEDQDDQKHQGDNPDEVASENGNTTE